MKRTSRGTTIREPYIPASEATEHLKYTIDEYDRRDTLVEVLGRLYDFDAAVAAFEACVMKYPGKRLFLRHGARVVRRSDEPKA